MTSPTPALIELTGVDVLSAHSGAMVISNVNWTIRSGERWVVAGVHGSGKSDLISTAAGLQKPITGMVRIWGKDMIGSQSDSLIDLRKRIGIVFKNGGRMFPHLTVAENIALPIQYHFDQSFSQAEKAVQQILELTGLEAHAQNSASSMGGNWLQRVGLARALALKPEVLFLDEPLSGLESKHRQWWQTILEQISRGIPWTDNRPTAVIIATNVPENWTAWGQNFARIEETRWTAPASSPIPSDSAFKNTISTPPNAGAPHRAPEAK